MFEKHKQRKAEKHYQAELQSWQQLRDFYSQLVTLAESSEGGQTEEILLKPGEALFVKVTGTTLVESRRARGHWEGRSSGVSIPVGSLGGRSIRYHVGGTRGTYVQGDAADTAIDAGTVYITNQRLIFEGSRQTRECRFDKLLGVQYDDESGQAHIAVSNRQKPTTIQTDPKSAMEFKFWLEFALAHYRGDTAGFVSRLKQDLARLDASRPRLPAAV